MNSKHQPIALWRQLQAVSSVLQAILAGRSATAAIETVQAELRPGVQSLSFYALRYFGRAQALRKLLATRTPPAGVEALLCTALALLWQREAAPYDAFTLVNQAVECAKKTPSMRPHASFINACLRRFLRERDSLSSQTNADPVAHWNHPAWWIAQLQTDWPQHWECILQVNEKQAPMALRVNTRRIATDAYLTLLHQTGINAKRINPWGIELTVAQPVQQLPGFADGWVSVQDAAAQLAAGLLLSNGFMPRRVLDACAAPGGKTAHLLELAELEVTALDIDSKRCQRIHENLQRLGVHAHVLAADACDTATWFNGEPFDAILLDAPCTGSGVVRRHPDIRWLRRASDVAQLAQNQARLLHSLWPLLKPGGRLLYCTCSVFRAEGIAQIEAFLAHNTNAALLPSPGHLLPGQCATTQGIVDNLAHDHDGFYYALLEKSAH
jgi:16S rRNA (cytosine967-C5)-methyltransferase